MVETWKLETPVLGWWGDSGVHKAHQGAGSRPSVGGKEAVKVFQERW